MEAGKEWRQNVQHIDQDDAKWSSAVMGKADQTIGKNGSALCAIVMAMIANGLKINGEAPTPASLNEWIKANKAYSPRGDIKWELLEPLGLKHEGQCGVATIKENINKGKICICKIPHPAGGVAAHYALGTKYLSGKIHFEDSGKTDRKDLMDTEVKNAEVFVVTGAH